MPQAQQMTQEQRVAALLEQDDCRIALLTLNAKPSLTEEEQAEYDRLRSRMSSLATALTISAQVAAGAVFEATTA